MQKRRRLAAKRRFIVTAMSLCVALQGCAAWHGLSDDQKFALVASIPLGVVIAAGEHQQDD